MCVTNTTSRRPQQQPVSLGAAQLTLSSSPYATATIAKPVQAVQQQPQFSAFPAFAPAQPFAVVPPPQKTRPKRRRKPQKPGKTAKQNDRHFVVHSYHDHSLDQVESIMESATSGERRKGGVSIPFPVKLHSVLDQVEADGLGHIVSWQPHGRCFVIHKPKEFVDHVMPK